VGLKINTYQIDKLFDEMSDISKEAMTESGKYFRSITPIDKGNARRRTSTVGKKIKADYGYAGKLDDGHSRQAPNGMSDPTIDYLELEIEKLIKRL